MKSKVMTVSFQNVSLILVLLSFNLHESNSFGNEFVHIKVHIPIENQAYEPPHHILHSPIPSSPKVIHHFHHRKRRPDKKNPFSKHAGLLESILLSEVNEPLSSDHYKYLHNAENIAKHIDSFIVKPEKPKLREETYKIIEETGPKEFVETYKVIENKIPSQQFHHHNYDTFDDGYNYKKPKGHTETYETIDELFKDYQTHFKDSETSYLPTKKQRFETVKIIESHEPDYEQEHTHFGDYSPSHGFEHDLAPHEDHGFDAGYHYNTKLHTDIVKIIETKAPHKHPKGHSVTFSKRPHSETVEIIKSSTPLKSNSFYNRPKHHQHNFNDHGYHYEGSSLGIGVGSSHEDTYSSSNDHKSHGNTYSDSYMTSPDEHYAQEPQGNYLPAKHTQSVYHHYHQNKNPSNMRQNTLYDGEPEPTEDPVVPGPDLDQPSALSLALKQSSGSSAKHWPSYNGKHKATETYTGIDSYSAPHVQGVSSSGYQYSSPYL